MELEQKRCKIFYSDGSKVQIRLGTITGETSDFFIVENNVYIPKRKIIRIEVIS